MIFHREDQKLTFGEYKSFSIEEMLSSRKRARYLVWLHESKYNVFLSDALYDKACERVGPEVLKNT